MIRLYVTDEQAKLLKEGLRLLTAKKESEYWDRERKSDNITDEFMEIDALMVVLDND